MDLLPECKSVRVSASEQLKIAEKNFKTGEEFKSSKKTLEKMMKQTQEILKHLDEFEEKLLKYSLPHLDESESLEMYLEKLKEFMKTWKQEAEKGRVKGEKSLIDWLRQFDQSHHNKERLLLRQ